MIKIGKQQKNKIAQAFLKHAKATSDSSHLLQPAKV
jgi:hypothetical protein